MKARANLRGIFLTGLLCALALAFATCGGSSHRVAPALQSGGQAIQAAVDVTLDEALAELDALPTPDGVDEALFAQLKDALASLLESRFSNRDYEDGSGGLQATTPLIAQPGDCASSVVSTTRRIVSSPPTGATNRIDDLACFLSDGEYVLSWLYRNCGDYDQNGAVGIEDITPLAMHFAEDTALDNEWIDGDSDGRVHISDITPIAMNFGVNVHHYSVQGSHFFSSQFTEVAQLEFPESVPNDARFIFEQSLGEEPEYLYWRIVPVDDEGNPGDASNTVEISEAPPPAVRILSINPLGGVTGTEVTFSAVISGEPPSDHAWDFGGGADPDESTEATPTVTLGAVGTYDAQLSVQNAEGGAVKRFTLTVSAEPGEPPQIISVSPTEGDSGTEVTFTAEVTGDGPFEYYWDFAGGASPNLSTGPAPTVILSRGGTLPEPVRTYPASLTVTNSSGTDVLDFNLNVSAWWHVLDVPYENVWTTTLTVAPDGKTAFIDGSLQTGYRYILWNGEMWEEEVLPIAVYSALGYGPLNGEPRALAKAAGANSIIYCWRANGTWHSEEVSLNEGWISTFSPDVAFRSDGSPVACWSLVGEPFTIRVARRTAQTWQVETLPTPAMDPRSASVFVDSNERAVVLFMDSTSPSSIWLAREGAAGWELEEVTSDVKGFEAAQREDRNLAVFARTGGAGYSVFFAEESVGSWPTSDVYTGSYLAYPYTIGLSFMEGSDPVAFYSVDECIPEEQRWTRERYLAWREGALWERTHLTGEWLSNLDWFRLVGVTPDGSIVLSAQRTDSPVLTLWLAFLW